MTSSDAATVLRMAQQLAMQKGPDSYQYEISPALTLSYQVAQRLMPGGERALKDVSPGVAKDAASLVAAIEKQGDKVVKELSKAYGKKLVLAKNKPLGLLVAARDDYRGVAPVEAWYEKVGYDKLLKKQQKKAEKIHTVWWNSKKSDEIFTITVDLIDDTFLIEGFEWNMQAKMEEWHESAKSLGIDKKALEKYKTFELWADGWKLGDKEYKKLWKKWKW